MVYLDWMEKICYHLGNKNKSVCMPIVTIHSQLPAVGYNCIIHKCGTGIRNFNCKSIKMVLSLKYFRK